MMTLEAWTRRQGNAYALAAIYSDHLDADAWWRGQRARLMQRTALFSNIERAQKVKV